MALLQIDLNPSPRDLRLFAGLGLPAFGALVGAAVLHLAGSLPVALAIWTLAALLALLGLRRLRFAKALYVGLARITLPIGLVVSLLVLILIYYAFLTPLGVVLRLVRPDPLQHRVDRSAESYWVRYDPPDEVRRYFQQF